MVHFRLDDVGAVESPSLIVVHALKFDVTALYFVNRRHRVAADGELIAFG